MATEDTMALWLALLGPQRVVGGAGLDPRSLRAQCKGDDEACGLWHLAGEQGRTDVCEYLKSKGLLDLIDRRHHGFTPLLVAMLLEKEETARWMVDNGADMNAATPDHNASAFTLACGGMSATFVEELASRVTPEQLTTCDSHGSSPMRAAFICNPEPLAVVRMLILRGVPARPEDFPARPDFPANLLPRRRELLASLDSDLDLNDRTFLGLFLAGGVHARNSSTPTVTTTTTTATTKRVSTQRPDGGWSDPVTVPCEPHLVVTAAPTIQRSKRVAARAENHLSKLRGFRNTEVRIGIAGFLGVREALDLKRLRAARDVLVALP